MKVVLSHLTGNANVKAAAYGFIEAGLLHQFHVSLAAFPGSPLAHLGSTRLFAEIRRRKFDISLKPFVRPWPWLEVGRLASPKFGLDILTREKGPFYIDTVCKKLDKRVASQLRQGIEKGVAGVYGYEDVAAFSFREAKKLGLQCFYDLPIGYWRTARRLLEIERQRWPEWESTIGGFRDNKAKLERKDEELQLADKIFVASSFTANTLKDYPHKLPPVEIIPYGFPPVFKNPVKHRKNGLAGPLKLLFVGSLTQRKGIANLFAALKGFNRHISLTLVGSKPVLPCAALEQGLANHRWIPGLAHDEVLTLMRNSDVLVFPSLFEGFGLVITEAMSQGTPVITTERTAGPDLIEHGKNGWLVEAGSVLALQQMFDYLLLNPSAINDAGTQAQDTARRRPWEVYGQELSASIKKHLQAVGSIHA
jgi:glycosyltransferase involved in cell wall biosynthesis